MCGGWGNVVAMRPQYLSPELFHFVGSSSPLDHERNYAVLKLVLSSGCVSHPPYEKGWGTVAYTLDLKKRLALEEMLIPTVTCYCDIPYDHLGPHIGKYGSFGLSFSRHHLTKFGARPVIYVPCRPDDWAGVFSGHSHLEELESTFRDVCQRRRTMDSSVEEPKRGVGLESRPRTLFETLQNAERTLALRVLAFVKPYESTLDDSDPQYFYSEREWRKLGNFVFGPRDVFRVVVHPSYLERGKQELAAYRDRLVTTPATDD